MKIYAQHYQGLVSEVIATELDINTLYTPEFVSTLIDVTDYDPPVQSGWQVVENPDGSFTIGPYVPTPAEVLGSQSLKLQGLTLLAASQKTALANRISVLNDAIELEMATPEEVGELPVRQAQLLEWKRYAVLLGRVTSQAGWYATVEWPVQPAEGMDLSVSAVAKVVQAS